MRCLGGRMLAHAELSFEMVGRPPVANGAVDAVAVEHGLTLLGGGMAGSVHLRRVPAIPPIVERKTSRRDALPR
jgi:hypothetical protein